MAKITRIAAISIPAFSHQASILEFCKRLVHLHHNIHVTCIFPTIDSPPPATISLLQSLPSSTPVDHIFLPPINKQDLPQDVPPAVQIQLAVSQSMPSFRATLHQLHSTTPFVALVADTFASEALQVAKDISLNLSAYIYFPPSAMTLSLFLHLKTLHNQVSCEYRDHKELIRIPGCIPIYGHDLPEHFRDRSSISYDLILRLSKRLLSLADGFLVNSFSEIERVTAIAIEEELGKKNTPVYLVGPIIQTGPNSDPNGPDCVRWLDNQRPNSVLYVSFGSGGTLCQEQVNEMALGLELSGQKFLWVLRAPSDSANAAYLGAENVDPLSFLPRGFLERTEGQGLVLVNWAPQTQILSHSSTGGFLTHCGWNSTLESIVMGVPMITWPLFAEQRMNAVLLTEGLKVGLRPKFNSDGIVERDEIAMVVKGLMVGEETNGIRQRIRELKDAAADALKEDGSSTRDLFQFGTRLENLKRGHQTFDGLTS
ncbi:hydroquinone glucosyltransferase-like [Arachis stenosperma]|uniref:hydroquinone glucosyltransferase-like n=1 Tax=Arachis stenosperma TaxID=217475 RepID=UPI0025AB8821|nr:hydroquinone glucosyltransferase-like [Arachis stenosperma]